MKQKILSFGSIGVLAASATLAIWALAASATNTVGKGSASSNDIPPPTPTVAGSFDDDESGFRNSLRRQVPQLAVAISAAETGELEALMASFRQESAKCTPATAKGGIAPWCSSLGLPEGSLVNLIREEYIVPRLIPPSQARELLAQVMIGTNPRLELTARHSDGGYFLSFRIAPVADAGTPNSFEHITFRALPSGELTSFHRTYGPSTPLDAIRLEEGYGTQKLYDVLWVSPELKAVEKDRERSDPTR